MTTGPPFWHRPTWSYLRYAVVLSVVGCVWFELIFAGANWLTAQRSYRVRLHCEAELQVPFVPAAVVPYLSLNVLFIMGPFVLRTRRELTAIVVSLAVVIGIAGIGFLLFPADNLFPPPGEMGVWSPAIRFAKWLALEYNLAPSLHVALATLCVVVYSRQAPPFGQIALWLWAGAIGLSAWLLHQHYVVDIVTGYLLAFVGIRFVYDRLLQTPPAIPARRPEPPA
jgi:membrane-associated phospholipid phosphatase